MPWYPLYHEAFDLDTGSWPCNAIGALMRLMNHQWANGSVPDDQEQLRRICRLDPGEWPKIWQILEPKFEPVASAPGHLINRRLAIEHERQTRRRKQAKNAIDKRWSEYNKKKGLDTDVPTDAIPDAYDLKLELELDKKKEREASPPLPDGLNVEAWEDWVANRRECKRKPYTPRSIKTQTRKLAELSHQEQRDLIDYSIANGYLGIVWDRIGGQHGRRERLGPAERIEKATGVKRL
jgi:uncharacterized protein YdaU (DUF1376 family)